MNISAKQGEILTCIENSTLYVICNPINCEGVINTALSREIRYFYPKEFKCYFNICKEHSDSLFGKCQMFKIESNIYVANMFCQADGVINFSCFEKVMMILKKKLIKYPKSDKITIRVPAVKRDLQKVTNIVNEIFSDTVLNIEIYY